MFLPRLERKRTELPCLSEILSAWKTNVLAGYKYSCCKMKVFPELMRLDYKLGVIQLCMCHKTMSQKSPDQFLL